VSELSFIAGPAIGSLYSAVLDPLVGPIKRMSMADGNKNNPTAFPVLGELTDAYYRNYINHQTLLEMARWSGYALNPGNMSGLGDINAAVFASKQPVIPPHLMLPMVRAGIYSEVEWTKNIWRMGITKPGAPQFLAALLGLPETTSILSQWQLGAINGAQAADLLKYHGITDPARISLLQSWSQPPGPGDTLDLYQSGIIDDASARAWLTAAGVRYGPHQQALMNRAGYAISNPAMVSQIYGAGVFSPDYLSRWNIYGDLTDDIRGWILTAGGGQPTVDTDYGPGGRKQVSWGEAQWAASRAKIPISLAFELLNRLRPSRVARYLTAGLQMAPFTADDFESVLKAANVPTSMLPYFYAMHYKPLPIRLLRTGVANGSISDQEASDQLQDSGYLPQDADLLVKTIHDSVDVKRTAYIQKVADSLSLRTVKAIEEAYTLGTLSPDQAAEQLSALGFPPESAAQIMAVSDLEFNNSSYKEILEATHSAFRSGAISVQETINALVQQGVQPARATQLVSRWGMLFTMPHKVSSAQEVVKWYKDGFLQIGQAIARLENLGYTDADSLLIVAEAQKGLTDSAAKQLHAETRTKAEAAKRLLEVAYEHQKQSKAAIARAKMLTPLSTLRKWLKDGVINTEYFIERVLQLGYPLDVAEKYLADALREPAKATPQAPTAQGG
jgi:hypothetical protein